jgi:hypothetical protein
MMQQANQKQLARHDGIFPLNDVGRLSYMNDAYMLRDPPARFFGLVIYRYKPAGCKISTAPCPFPDFGNHSQCFRPSGTGPSLSHLQNRSWSHACVSLAMPADPPQLFVSG